MGKLHDAAQAGDAAGATKALDNSADVNATDEYVRRFPFRFPFLLLSSPLSVGGWGLLPSPAWQWTRSVPSAPTPAPACLSECRKSGKENNRPPPLFIFFTTHTPVLCCLLPVHLLKGGEGGTLHAAPCAGGVMGCLLCASICKNIFLPGSSSLPLSKDSDLCSCSSCFLRRWTEGMQSG